MIDPNVDQIFIDDLRVRAILGIFDHERDRRQELRLNLVIATDVRPAAATDDIADAVDYKTVTKRILDYVENSEFFLVETLVEKLAALIIDEFGVAAVRIRVDKPGALRYARSVGIAITRTRD